MISIVRSDGDDRRDHDQVDEKRASRWPGVKRRQMRACDGSAATRHRGPAPAASSVVLDEPIAPVVAARSRRASLRR